MPGAVAASGNATSARFFGGSQVQGTTGFSNSFQSSDSLEVSLSFSPESQHIGSSGNAYVVAIAGGVPYSLLDSGDWQLFDGTVAGLKVLSTYSSLSSIESLSVDTVNSLLEAEGVNADGGQVSFFVYLAYDASVAAGDLFYTGAPLQFTVTTATDGTAQELFESNVSSQIVEAKCVVCHATGGIAESTGFIFERSSATSSTNNISAFSTLASSQGIDHILNKASGGNSHGGGTQLPLGGSDYNNLQAFLNTLVNGVSTGGGSTPTADTFFSSVQLQSPEETLRRAAIMLAGRAPTQAELNAVQGNNDASLRATVRSLMQGDTFHEFIKDGANDQLLVRGTLDGSFLDDGGMFYLWRNRMVELRLDALARGLSWTYDLHQHFNTTNYGLVESPLELIAHVVENEKPYSEILTADYMMLNPFANTWVDGTATFNNPNDQTEFQPGRMPRYRAWSEDVREEEIVEIQEWRITDPGNLMFDFPHAGVLNTQAFLFRYPTTPTNRNRARARWTFLHFLDVDIERSAQRTTDPVALADTNNPTMFNENCTVCHATMDPVAGAFQNYFDEGYYRQNGKDSLDDFYKWPDDGTESLYQEGDTWYRDMRSPGIFGDQAPDNSNSLQWLAQHIVQNPGFARATVKFWWPAIMGHDPLLQPQVQTDGDYQSRLMAFDEQSSTIQQFADSFAASGMNLKDLLADMIVSPWFRATGVDDANLSETVRGAHLAANLGTELLLTPERLAAKTSALTGFSGSFTDSDTDSRVSDLVENFGLYYGGIDSNGVIKRSTEMTALMSNVALSHAIESACPIVLKEFTLTDGNRKLFNGYEDLVTPLLEGAEKFELETTYDNSVSVSSSTTVQLDTAPKNAIVSINNGFCDWNEATQVCDSNTFLNLDKIEIRYPSGTLERIEPNAQNSVLPSDCAWYAGDSDAGLCGAGTIKFPFTPQSSGLHEITATVTPIREGGDHPQARSLSITVGFESAVSDAKASTANGAQQIKQKLVELHQVLHGKTYAIDSAEITAAYELFVDSWDELRNLPNASEYTNIMWSPETTCNWQLDEGFSDGLSPGFDPVVFSIDEPEGWPNRQYADEMWDYLSQFGSDPQFIKNSWVTVMAYLLSHYDYLYE